MTHPQPLADFVQATFALFAEKHPWLRQESLDPKSIAREMFEGMLPFDHCARGPSAAASRRRWWTRPATTCGVWKGTSRSTTKIDSKARCCACGA